MGTTSLSQNRTEYEYNKGNYNILIYIELSEITFQIKSINTNPIIKFINSFSLNRLIEINNYFVICKTLESALRKFNNLLGANDYFIRSNNENNNIIHLFFHLMIL